MNKSKENLEGLVSKLKEQGIDAGNKERDRIIESARKEADHLIKQAEKQSQEMIDEAKRKADQFETIAHASIKQASRDMIESTKIELLRYFKAVFRKQSDKLFTQEQYSGDLLKALIEVLPGNKTISLSDNVLREMEKFLMNQGLKEEVVLKPLGENSPQIVVESNGKDDVRYVLNSEGVEHGLFSLLNKDLVELISNGQ